MRKTYRKFPVLFNTNQAIQFEKLNQVLSEFAMFFKLDGVFGIDIIKGKRLVIDYPNRNVQIFD